MLRRCVPLLRPCSARWLPCAMSVHLSSVDYRPGSPRYAHPFVAWQKIRGVNPRFSDSPSSAPGGNDGRAGESARVSSVAKLRHLVKDYGYVVVPVHIALTAAWFTIFYTLIKYGVDFSVLVSTAGSSEKLAKLGPFAATVVCMKILAPVRYVTTIAVATVTVKVLVKKGMIRSSGELKEQLKEQMEETKENLKERFRKDK